MKVNASAEIYYWQAEFICMAPNVTTKLFFLTEILHKSINVEMLTIKYCEALSNIVLKLELWAECP